MIRQVCALTAKDLRLLLRDRIGFFFTFFFPLLYAIFFGALFSGGAGGGGAISLAVVDEDSSAASLAFVEGLADLPELSVLRTGREEALNRVRRGRSTAYIVLLPGFGAAQDRLFWGEPPRIELGIDPARKAEAGLLQGVLFRRASDRLRRLFSDDDLMRRQLVSWRDSLNSVEEDDPQPWVTNLDRFFGDLDRFLGEESRLMAGREDAGAAGEAFELLRIEERQLTVRREGPASPFAISFPQGVIWGVLGGMASFGVSLVAERRRGTLRRLRAAPLGRARILAGKALACFLTLLCLCLLIFAVGRLFFDVIPGSPLLLGLALLCTAAAFVGLMMLVSVTGRTEQAVSGIGWAMVVVMAMLGGGMIPLFFMPAWMQTLSHVSPVKWAILAMEGALWRGFSPAEMALPCGILLGTGLVTFAVGLRAFRWSQEA